MPHEPGHRPTATELIGMSIGQIGELFAPEGQRFDEGKFEKEYGMYIPTYDPFREEAATEMAGSTVRGQRQEYGFGRTAISRQEGGAGFAGGIGGFEKRQTSLRESFGRRLSDIQQGLETDIYGYREQFAEDVYGALGALAERSIYEGLSGGRPLDVPPGADEGLYSQWISDSQDEMSPYYNMSWEDYSARYGDTSGGETGGDNGGIGSGVNFPNNPYQGQTFTDVRGENWTYTKNGWEITRPGKP